MENYQKALSNGESFSISVDGVGVSVEIIDGAAALTASQVGKELVLSAAAGAAITLPAPIAGLKYKFTIGSAFATTAWTVTATSTIIQGTVIVNGASVLGSDENTVTFAAGSETIGDFVELWSDGTNWYVSGVGSAASSITLTAV